MIVELTTLMVTANNDSIANDNDNEELLLLNIND